MSKLYLHYDKFYILWYVLTLYGLTECLINEWITMIRRKSNNQWSGGIAAHPAPQKKSECKNPLEKSSHRFFGITPPHWLSSKGPNYQRRVLLISAVTTEGDFEGKTPRKFTKGVLFLHDNAPAHRTLASQKKLAYLGFKCLDYPHYSLDLVPLDYHLLPRVKKQLKGRHFSSNTEVIAAAETWLDEQPSDFFFSALQ